MDSCWDSSTGPRLPPERVTATGTRGQNRQAEATRRATRFQRLQNQAVQASARGFMAARRSAGAFIGVLAGASGIAVAVRSATNFARAINRIQVITGLTTGEVQRLQAAFRTVGVELDQSGDAILDIVERIGEGFTDLGSQVSKSLQAIGIDPRSLRDIDNFEGRLQAVAGALSQIEDAGERLFRAREIFGDTAAEAVSLIGTIQGQRALGDAQGISVIEQEELDRLVQLDARGRTTQSDLPNPTGPSRSGELRGDRRADDDGRRLRRARNPGAGVRAPDHLR